MRPGLSRRAVLAGLAGLVVPTRAGAAPGALRVAALDWALAAASLSIGVVPAGVAEQRLYRRWVRDPALPEGVVELGLRAAPSLEGLAALAPDLILINELDAPLRPALDRIAPTLSLSIYGDERRPLALARDALRDLGRRSGREAEAEAFVAATELSFDRRRTALASTSRRPVLVFNVIDARHLRLFGTGSLFADVLVRLGLAPAWPGPTSPWGTVTADIAALAEVPDATLLVVEPIPDEARLAFEAPGLWRALTTGRSVHVLPPAWPYGEVSAARRFADLVTAALVPANPVPEAGGLAHAG